HLLELLAGLHELLHLARHGGEDGLVRGHPLLEALECPAGHLVRLLRGWSAESHRLARRDNVLTRPLHLPSLAGPRLRSATEHHVFGLALLPRLIPGEVRPPVGLLVGIPLECLVLGRDVMLDAIL